MNTAVISIAKDFSRYPAGRFVDDGPFPGETFRKKLLVPALRDRKSVIVKLDGTPGYGSSFLEEAFGGLVRLEGFNLNDLKAKLSVEHRDQSIVDEVWGYIEKAKPE